MRQCKSVDEIVAEVKRFAAEHPDDEWIVGASYESSLAPSGLFDARWLDAAVPDRPVVLRAWDYHTVWVQQRCAASGRASPPTPRTRCSARFPRREDGSVLGTLREWGAVDLVYAVVPARDRRCAVGALRTAADYYLARGVTWVQDAWVEPADVDTYLDAARAGCAAACGSTWRSTPIRATSTRNSTQFADARRRGPGCGVAAADREHR